ncbi:hypothetical protein [Streptomyces viridosporus]|nr:hypothetical protein [Streptomyces viridosporus]
MRDISMRAAGPAAVGERPALRAYGGKEEEVRVGPGRFFVQAVPWPEA